MKYGLSLATFVFAFVVAGAALTQERDGCVSLHSTAGLAPPESAENQDASGGAHLHQVGDRSVLHVHVHGLEAGATYDVRVANHASSASTGMITTRTGEVPPPRRFSARLRSPADSVTEGDGGTSRLWGKWLEHWRSRRGGGEGLRAHASFTVNADRTELRYSLHVRGRERLDSATLQVGDALIGTDFLSFDLDVETLRGALEANEDLLAALEAEEGTVFVQSGDTTLSGVVKARFRRLQEWIAGVLAGRGSLRIDTARDDALPLDAASVEELVGAAITIVDANEQVVLGGTFGELMEGSFFRWRCRQRDAHDSGGGDEQAGESEAIVGLLQVGGDHDASFIRGDANDDSKVDISDPIFVLNFLFGGGAAPYCADSADANDSGALDVSDPIFILISFFDSSTSISAPFPEPGFDSTADELACNESRASN